MKNEKIWLIDMGDDIVWCDSPDPSDDIDHEDVTEYIRKDIADKAAKDVGIACVRKTGEAYKAGYEDARIEVREECAKIADACGKDAEKREGDYWNGKERASDIIAKAIRSEDE